MESDHGGRGAAKGQRKLGPQITEADKRNRKKIFANTKERKAAEHGQKSNDAMV